jgi:hypothetical protein
MVRISYVSDRGVEVSEVWSRVGCGCSVLLKGGVYGMVR